MKLPPINQLALIGAHESRTEAPSLEQAGAALEKIIRPIVEGQIRGFLKEHPVVVDAVDWYKPRRDKATTLVNSLSKRIVRDLTCGMTTARLETALLDAATDTPSDSLVEDATAANPARLELSLSEPVPHRERRAHVLRSPAKRAPALDRLFIAVYYLQARGVRS